jgi:hypothetical protein
MAENTPAALPLNVKNMVGQRFTRLVVLSYHGQRRKNAEWLCSCDCEPGKTTLALRCTLISGDKKSCGCLNREYKASLVTHGGTYTDIFGIWTGIKTRCLNPNCPGYARYGPRGLCEEWENSFETFRDDMGPRPSPLHTVDRIDNNGPYCKANCRWALPEVQQNNKSTNKRLLYDGQNLTYAQWTKIKGFRKNTIRNRVVQGWDVERIMETPDDGPRKNPVKMIEYQGKLMRSSEVARLVGLPSYVLLGRLNMGWPLEKALNTPLQNKNPAP